MAFTATQSGDLEITLTFSPVLVLTGSSGVNAAKVASWGLTSLGAGVGAEVQSVSVESESTIKLGVSLMTDGEDYEVEVLGAIDDTGGSVQGETDSLTADVSLPNVSLVVVIDKTTVEVTFDRDMRKNADLLNPTKYSFTGGITAASVARISPRTVRVTTTEQTTDALYELTVLDS